MQFNFKASEFLVEEITLDGRIVTLDKSFTNQTRDGEFVHFAMQKTNWTTADAVKQIAKTIHAGSQRFNWAGTKDRNATTTQLVSCFGKSALEPLQKLTVKDIKILGIWTAKKKVKLGNLKGNRFTIMLTKTNCNVEEIKPEEIEKKMNALNCFSPNFFGSQRFGIRNNTHIVGSHMLNEDFELAIWEILTGSSENENNEIAKKARKDLNENKDFAKAFEEFPKHLRIERDLLKHLKCNPNDFIGAFRKLQRESLLIFVHAYQSYLFNELLTLRIKQGNFFELEEGSLTCDLDDFGFPNEEKSTTVTRENKSELEFKFKEGKIVALDNLIGLKTNLTLIEEKILQKYGLSKEAFKLPSIPELETKGSTRPRLVKVTSFKTLSQNPLTIQFCLPSGAYATSVLNWAFDSKEKEVFLHD